MKHHISFDLEFKKNPYKGKFISFEGIDGSGKSLQLENFKKHLGKAKKEVIVVRESKTPGPIGDLIRLALHKKITLETSSFQHLYVAQRAFLYQEIIIPSLIEGKIVLSDRCFWSAIPYGISDEIYSKDLENWKKVTLIAYSILSFYHQFIIPDMTIYIDVPVDVAMSRLNATGKTLDMYEKKEKLKNILRLYQWLLETFPKEFTVVNGDQPVERITEEIFDKVKNSI